MCKSCDRCMLRWMGRFCPAVKAYAVKEHMRIEYIDTPKKYGLVRIPLTRRYVKVDLHAKESFKEKYGSS